MALTVEREFKGKPISLRAEPIGDDLLLILTGGDKAHVGSCLLAEPHEGIHPGDPPGATTSVINRLKHLDEVVGREAAEKVAVSMGAPVALVCGIHYDEITPQEIDLIVSICRELTAELIAALRGAL